MRKKYLCIMVHYDRTVNFKLIDAHSYEHACNLMKHEVEGEHNSLINAYPIYPKLVGEIEQMFKEASKEFTNY